MAFKRIQLGSVDLSGVENKYLWYPVVTLFNHEEAFARNFREAITGTPWEHLVNEIYVPTKHIKEIVTLKDGTQKPKIHHRLGAYSNYVFVRCILTEALWNMLRNTTGVAVILSTGGIPSPIDNKEIRKIKEQQQPEGFTKAELEDMRKKNKAKYIITEIEEDNSLVEEMETVDQKIDYAIENNKIICTPDSEICAKFLEKISDRREVFGFSSEEKCESPWGLFKHNTAFSFEGGKLHLCSKETYDKDKIILNEFDFAKVAEG